MKRTRSQSCLIRLPREELRRLSIGEKLKRGIKLGGAYYVSKDVEPGKVTKRTPIITVSSWKDARLGITHGKAAKLRKAKQLGYGPQGLSENAPKSVRTRRRLAEPQYDKPWQHIYINTDGAVSYDFFWKHGLRHMQDYQDALDDALVTHDGIGLLRFKHIKIMTYDGPGLPGYYNKNTRIYPETNIDKLLAKRASMTDREKARFDADRRYRDRVKLAA